MYVQDMLPWMYTLIVYIHDNKDNVFYSCGSKYPAVYLHAIIVAFIIGKIWKHSSRSANGKWLENFLYFFYTLFLFTILCD